MADNDTLEESDGGRQQMEIWREEREKAEKQRLGRWTDSLMVAAAVIMPLLGMVWCAVLCLFAEGKEDEMAAIHDRRRGLTFLGWALLGCILWLLLRPLWIDVLFGGAFRLPR